MSKKSALYPISFIPMASEKPWGGSALIEKLGKTFTRTDEKGNETILTTSDLVGESWELADMGKQDSVVANGSLAGNTISDLMETYMDEMVGESCYNFYGNQFPLLIKFLDINDKLSVQVHPSDEVAIPEYDSLGKCEMWYVLDSKPGAVVYMGFNRDVTPQEFYDKCKNGTAQDLMNAFHPSKGDVFYIKAGTVHAADAGVMIAEVQESSDLTFRLYDWGREFNPATARPMHLEQAFGVIDFSRYDESCYMKAPRHSVNGEPFINLVNSPEFIARELALDNPIKVMVSSYESFIVYMGLEGSAAIVYNENSKLELKRGQTVLVPACTSDIEILPLEKGTRLLEATVVRGEPKDSYLEK